MPLRLDKGKDDNIGQLLGLQKDNSIGGDTFFASDESEALGGSRFDVDLIGIDFEGSGNGDGHRPNVRGEFWLLRHDGGIGVDDLITAFFDDFSGFFQ